MPPIPEQPCVHDYLDYRSFFDDWLAWKLATRSRYSLRAFARRAGVSHIFVAKVRDRERHLSAETAGRFAQAMGLDAAACAHFELLVTQATVDAAWLQDELRQRARGQRGMASPEGLTALTMTYLSSWWIPVVRELAYRPDFRADPAWIAERIRPPIAPVQAEAALETLRGLGLLCRQPDG